MRINRQEGSLLIIGSNLLHHQTTIFRVPRKGRIPAHLVTNLHLQRERDRRPAKKGVGSLPPGTRKPCAYNGSR